MKYTFATIGLIILVSIFMFGCQGEGSVTPVDPPIEETPIVEPIPPTFEEVVLGKFWQVEGIERYQDTRPPARSGITLPYEKDICMLWETDVITAFEDLNDDGFMSPGEDVASVAYSIVGDTITIDGLNFEINSFDANGWSMVTYLDGITNPDWIGGVGDDWVGYIVVHYIPCLYPWKAEEISFEFAFVFDDMGDTTASWEKIRKYCWTRYQLDIDYDWADAFYFTSGTPLDSYIEDEPIVGNHIIVVDYHDGYGDDIDSLIIVITEQYGLQIFPDKHGFEMDEVYDMSVVVYASDAALFSFVSRVDGGSFDVDAKLDFSEMGELIIRAVDDADVPVVNP